MGNKAIIIFCCIITLLYCCTTNSYLPGFDFSLFSETPVRDLAVAVEKEDVGKIAEILKDKSINIDYREPTFGHTLLMLAVANNKVKSTEILLEKGANPNLLSNDGSDNAMSIACNEFYTQSCYTTILSKLIFFKGDLNQPLVYYEDSLNGKRKNVKYLLNTAIYSSKCLSFIKYMINHGANINYYPNGDSSEGPITNSLLVDNLEVTKYLIIDMHAVVPSCILKRPANNGYECVSITDLLKEQHYENGTKNDSLRLEIINYLKGKNLK